MGPAMRLDGRTAQRPATRNGFAPGVLIPGTNLADGTITVGYIPSSHLIIKLDNRLDLADRPVYPSKNGIVDHQTVTVLGVVVTTE
jgi:hypothetical protein